MGRKAALERARRADDDEFYTRLDDIECEVGAYVAHDPGVFRDKVVMLPCDDPARSQFVRFFVQNFGRFGLRRLVATSIGSGVGGAQRSLFDEPAEPYDPDVVRGRALIVDRDVGGACDVSWQLLVGDGDFRSDEVCRLRDEADIIVTNPPFSLFREFFAWIGERQFLVVAPLNALAYADVFPAVLRGAAWCGSSGKDRMLFDRVGSGDGWVTVFWLTNLVHGVRVPLPEFSTRAENEQLGRYRWVRERGYLPYVNFDAVEVPFVGAIPSDYDGAMGVPITYLLRHDPEMFEIIGIAKSGAGDPALRTYIFGAGDDARWRELNAASVLFVDGEFVATFTRVLIRRRSVDARPE